jgi:hypothetical protein
LRLSDEADAYYSLSYLSVKLFKKNVFDKKGIRLVACVMATRNILSAQATWSRIYQIARLRTLG